MGVVGIVGAGRVGAGLALALTRVGREVRLISRRPVRIPAPLSLKVAPDGPDAEWVSGLEVLFLAVPDDRIHPVAQQLWGTKSIGPGQTVLHCSGVLGQEALSALVPTRAALGSLHPLQTISDPEVAPERFKGAWAAVEGSPAAME
ncbi:MAG TPA: NAD(P)-binding domain-containing protein, partial [Gemmatimonadales bacterium]